MVPRFRQQLAVSKRDSIHVVLCQSLVRVSKVTKSQQATGLLR